MLDRYSTFFLNFCLRRKHEFQCNGEDSNSKSYIKHKANYSSKKLATSDSPERMHCGDRRFVAAQFRTSTSNRHAECLLMFDVQSCRAEMMAAYRHAKKAMLPRGFVLVSIGKIVAAK